MDHIEERIQEIEAKVANLQGNVEKLLKEMLSLNGDIQFLIKRDKAQNQRIDQLDNRTSGMTVVGNIKP